MSHPSTTESLVGKTIYKYSIPEYSHPDTLTFYTTEGYIYTYYHDQDCCETVAIEDICGELDNLLHNPILTAEVRESDARDVKETGTWTFYEFATIKGSVTIRWLGESNGFYSESVDLKVTIDKELMSEVAPELLI